ncbi:hypothetical protein [Streptomyces sp. NPDC003522]
MITRSVRQPVPDDAVPPLSPSTGADRASSSAAGAPAPAEDVRTAYPDPVDGLLHAAAAHRPLEDVVRLVALLEESEEGRQAAADVLRAIGTDRPVEDVARLVAVLSRSPHDAGHADHVIRAAAGSRPVEEVTRLMTLLYREPLERHCGDEAVRAAAAHRPVEELAELVARLARHRREGAAGPRPVTGPVQAAPEEPSAPSDAVESPARVPVGPSTAPARLTVVPVGLTIVPVERSVVPVGSSGATVEAPARRVLAFASAPAPAVTAPAPPPPPAWTARTDRAAAVTLALCGVAHIAVHRQGVSVGALAATLALSGLCLLLSLALLRRPALPLLVPGVLVPAVFAGAQASVGGTDVMGLLPLAGATLAPPWIAAPVAVTTAVTAAAALLVRLRGDRRTAPAREPDRAAAVLPVRD